MAAEPHSHEIREIQQTDRAGFLAVGEIHMEQLGFGPMAGLGERFVREICYERPVQDENLRLAVCEVDGETAGFVAYTDRSITFHRSAFRRHWIYAGWLTALSLLERPARLKALWRALRVIGSRRGEIRVGSDPMGEVAAIAVRPRYLTGAFVRASGIRVSDELVRYAARRLRDLGVDEMRMLVDADNKAALFLYHRLGAKFEDYSQAGEPMVQVWFDLNVPAWGEARGGP
jgi:ribosomal protein S18 acetylase RimI-like enzyme